MDDGVTNSRAPANPGDSERAGERDCRLDLQETTDGSRTLFSGRYGQTFHSHHGAVTESRHVFLEGSGVAARLRKGNPVRVLEVGFGTGLNFLLTAQEARSGRAGLGYVALEQEFLPADVLASLDYRDFAPEPFAALLDFRGRLPEVPRPGTYRMRIAGADLEVHLGEAVAAEIEHSSFHAVYQDAFSPDANPELWEPAFLSRLAASLAPGGRLVSYTVKGEVRRRLAAAGLEVSKLPGPPGGKREMLRAVRTGDA